MGNSCVGGRKQNPKSSVSKPQTKGNFLSLIEQDISKEVEERLEEYLKKNDLSYEDKDKEIKVKNFLEAVIEQEVEQERRRSNTVSIN